MQLTGLAALRNSTARSLARRPTNEAVEYAEEDDLDGMGTVYKFNYPNYNLDPKPRVLVLGFYKHQKTDNTLMGGLNLNYMTSNEVAEVKRVLPLILRAGNLKDRYWAGRKTLPDIFKSYYRTYDRGQATLIKPIDLKPEMAGGEKGPEKGEESELQKGPPLPLTGRIRDLQRPQPPEERPPPEPEAGDRIEKIKQALGRQAPDKEPINRPVSQRELTTTKPAIGATPQAKIDAQKEILTKRTAQAELEKRKLQGDLHDRLRTKVKDKIADKKAEQEVQRLEKTAAPDPAAGLKSKLLDKARPQLDQKKIKKPTQKPLRGGIGGDLLYLDPTDNYGDSDTGDAGGDVIGNLGTAPDIKKQKLEGYRRHPLLGLIWESADAYRRLHRPSAFLTNKKLAEDTASARIGCPLLAVVNVRTGETLLDRVLDHSQIIEEAGWNYRESIRLLPIQSQNGGTRIHILYDDLPADMVKRALKKVPALVVRELRGI